MKLKGPKKVITRSKITRDFILKRHADKDITVTQDKDYYILSWKD